MLKRCTWVVSVYHVISDTLPPCHLYFVEFFCEFFDRYSCVFCMSAQKWKKCIRRHESVTQIWSHTSFQLLWATSQLSATSQHIIPSISLIIVMAGYVSQIHHNVTQDLTRWSVDKQHGSCDVCKVRFKVSEPFPILDLPLVLSYQ